MSDAPSITIGVPIFHGQKFLSKALQSIQEQTYRAFTVLMSVDGGDRESAEICRPLLYDPRFKLHIHERQLGWAANCNWLLSEVRTEFFCYYPQDDFTDPRYFEVLMEAAARYRDAAGIYTDVQWVGDQQHVVVEEESVGDAIARQCFQIEKLHWIPLLGLTRRGAIVRAGPFRINEFDSYAEDVVWVAKLAAAGELRRVPHTYYYKRLHSDAVHKSWHAWDQARRRGPWIVLCVGLLDAALRVATSADERLYLMFRVLDRLANDRPDRWMFFTPQNELDRRGLVMDFLNRARKEGILTEQETYLAGTGRRAAGFLARTARATGLAKRFLRNF